MTGIGDWQAGYQALTVSEREQFTRILNKLLSQNFIVKRKEDNRKDYYFLQRHQELFREYFKIGGWNLVSDAAAGVFYLQTREGYNRLQLKMEDSIIILIIRLLYEEKRGEVKLTEDIILRVGEIQERYRALKIKKRPIDKRVLRETLGMLKRFNILDSLDGEMSSPECRMVVYPSLLYAVKVEDIRRIYEKLHSYAGNNTVSGEGAEIEDQQVEQEEREDQEEQEDKEELFEMEEWGEIEQEEENRT